MESQFIGDNDEISMWKRDKYGNAMQIAFMMKIPKWKRDYCGKAVRSTAVMKFQWETDKYSTALNIQNPSVESRFWEEKMLVPNNYLCRQGQKLCDVIIY